MIYKPGLIALFTVIIAVIGLSDVFAEGLELTQDEKTWLESNPVLRVSGPRAFPPFHFVAENGSYRGMADDYLSLVAEMIGIKLEYHTGLFWPDVLKKIELKELDIIPCAAKSPDRERYLKYTTPHLSFPIVIINRKDAPFISGLEGLHKKRIALTKGIMTHDWLIRDGIEFEPSFASTMVNALEQVSVGMADATVQNLAASSYIIEKQGFTNLKVAAPTPYGNYDLAMAVRNDWPELVTILNKALARISPEQHNVIRQNWIAIRYDHGVRYRDIIFWTTLIAVAAGSIIWVVSRWNRKLAGEIRERRRTERKNVELIDQLKQAIDEIHTLKGILPLCSYCKKIRSEDGCWEQVDVYIHKYSQADISHSICPDCAKAHYPGVNLDED